MTGYRCRLCGAMGSAPTHRPDCRLQPVLITPGEAARLLYPSWAERSAAGAQNALGRLAAQGKLRSVRTSSAGHRRYFAEDILALLRVNLREAGVPEAYLSKVVAYRAEQLGLAGRL